MKLFLLLTFLATLSVTLSLSIWDRADFNFFKGAGGEVIDTSKLTSTQLAALLRNKEAAASTDAGLLDALNGKTGGSSSNSGLSDALKQALAG